MSEELAGLRALAASQARTISDMQGVIEMAGAHELDIDMFYYEQRAEILREGAALMADMAQELRAGAFAEFEIIGVIDNAARIGVFVIDADIHCMAGHSSSEYASICAEESLERIPRYSNPFDARTRPRGVRWSRPC